MVWLIDIRLQQGQDQSDTRPQDTGIVQRAVAISRTTIKKKADKTKSGRNADGKRKFTAPQCRRMQPNFGIVQFVLPEIGQWNERCEMLDTPDVGILFRK